MTYGIKSAFWYNKIMLQEQTTNENNHSAKFAFLYMLSLVALVLTSLSTGMVIFQIINKYISDPVGRFGQVFSPELLRFAIAALIVAAPIFFLTSRQIYKDLSRGVLDKDSGVRKWLTYFILLVSSVIILGWFIGLINSYLGGELTIKFILKAITAMGISAAAFSFYLYDIRRDQVLNQKDNVVRMYFYGSLVIIAAVFVSALLIAESPQQARERKLDEAILEDFETISRGLDAYYDGNQKLPATLEELESEVLFVTDENLEDSETGRKYEYRVVGNRKYQLCAVFRTSNVDDPDANQFNFERWPHKAGEQCLDQSINSELVKPVIPGE